MRNLSHSEIDIPEPVADENIPDEYRPPYGWGVNCQDCDGYGNVIGPDGARVCECKKRFFERQRVERLVLPPEYAGMSLSNFKLQGKGAEAQERLLQTAQGYVEQFPGEGKGLFLFGAPGCGKTHIALGILKELNRRGFNPFFAFYLDGRPSMVRSIWEYLRDKQGPPPFFLERGTLDVDFVVVDDLGAGRDMTTDVVREQVNTFFRDCYLARVPMIVTSNLDLEQLENQFGESTVSRLEQRCIAMDCNDIPSWRKRGARKVRV